MLVPDHGLAACCASAPLQVWPYLKPLRKWIKRQQRSNPDEPWDMPVMMTPPAQQQQQQRERKGQKQQRNKAADDELWDMPVMTTPPSQQQQQDRKGGERQQRNNNGDGMWDMPVIGTPLSQQQQRGAAASGPQLSPLQQLVQGERRSSGGGSPKHTLHMQFHEAAIVQARQQAAVSTGPRLVPPSAGAGVSAAGSARPTLELPASGPLARLFGGAQAQTSGADGSPNLLAATPGSFTFNRQPILHALNSQGAPLRYQISGRG